MPEIVVKTLSRGLECVTALSAKMQSGGEVDRLWRMNVMVNAVERVTRKVSGCVSANAALRVVAAPNTNRQV